MDLKILTFNIHKGVGWLSRKSTMHAISTSLMTQNPDIVFLQEIRVSQFNMLCDLYGSQGCFGKNAIYLTEHHGNAILSKFPIEFIQNLDLTMHRFETRGLLHAVIKIDNFSHVDLMCVHLGLFEKDRRKQLFKIIDYIQATLPDTHPLILAGDFNDWSDFSSQPLQKSLALNEVFFLNVGKCARTFPAWAPLFRLDRIYVRGFEPISTKTFTEKSWRVLSDHIAIATLIKSVGK